MEPFPNLAEIPDEFRLSKLRELANDLNQRLAGFHDNETENTDKLLTNIYDRDADYLYFAILQRVKYEDYFYSNGKVAEEYIRNLKFLGYGDDYDDAFENFIYNPQDNEYGDIPSDVYIFLKYPNELKLSLSLEIMTVLIGKFDVKILRVLYSNNRDTAKDFKIAEIIKAANNYIVSPSNKEKYKFEQLVTMIMNDEFDVIDMVYLVFAFNFEDLINKYTYYQLFKHKLGLYKDVTI